MNLRSDLETAIRRIVGAGDVVGTSYLVGYPREAIDAELAMALYRAAIARGLHQTGVEASLSAHIERLEGMLAKAGVDLVRGAAAAEALSPPPVVNVFDDPPRAAGHDRSTCQCGYCVAERHRVMAALGVR